MPLVTATPATTEDVAHDDLCPICQLLLFTPVRTQCNHLLCASCMAQWVDASTTNSLQPSSLDVNLTDFDPNIDLTQDLEANCPMCRTHSKATADKVLAQQLEQKYPVAYAERRTEEEVAKGSRIGQDGIEGIMILIGNKHRLVRGADDANQHDWTFFVRTSRPELIKHVAVDLHPTFRPPTLTLRTRPYEVRRLGWGWFTIDAEIVLKEPYRWIVDNAGTQQTGLELSWTLNFEDRGKQALVKSKVKKIEEHLGRGMRHGASIVNGPDLPDEDDEDDENFAAMEEDETSSDEYESDEDVSEYISTPRR